MPGTATASIADLEKARRLHGAGRLGEAVPIYRELLRANPRDAEALHLLGVAHFQVGESAEALELMDRALAARTAFPEALNNRGNVLKALGRTDEARESYRAAIAVDPGYAMARFQLGVLHWEQGDLAAAVESYREAVRCRPDFAAAFSNLGTALRDLGELDEAAACYRKALALQPPRAETLGGLGVTLARLDRAEEALACYNQALGLDPDHIDSHLSRAMLLLSLGRFEEGWPEFEYRLRTPHFAVSSRHGRLWRGENLEGKTVLCLPEQGLGDTLQFVRFASVLAHRASRVLLAAPASLMPILGTVAGIELVAEDAIPPGIDFHVPLMSLPGRLGVTLDGLPAGTNHLRADSDRVARWAPRLGEAGLRVGIAWQGNPRADVDRGRSLPLAELAPLFSLAGIQFVSLQKGDGAEQVATVPFGPRIIEFGNELDAEGAFLDTAAIVANLDLVVTTDTSIAHLAGAIGATTFVLLQHSPDWRWLRGREDSPWYPAMRLYRQQQRGDWSAPIARIRDELASRLAERAR